MPPTMENRKSVAVIGSGMAGLVAAYLCHRDQKYEVEMFENEPEITLSAASLWRGSDHIDVPMRAFSEGYYPELTAMYRYLGVEYKRQAMLFTFAALRPEYAHATRSLHLEGSKRSTASTYFMHADNSHAFPPPRPQSSSYLTYTLRVLFAGICYLWFALCCSYVDTREDETVQEYIRRIRLPRRFTNLYLLPLMSAIASCSHNEILAFPADDLVRYRRKIIGGRQFVATRGVQDAQARLLSDGLKVHYNASVGEVELQGAWKNVSWQSGSRKFSKQFDSVILAVPPNIAAEIFPVIKAQLLRLPTRSVKVVVHSNTKPTVQACNANGYPMVGSTAAQNIELMTGRDKEDAYTEATHKHHSGVSVTTFPLRGIVESTIHAKYEFTRVLRTTDSRRATAEILGLAQISTNNSVSGHKWRNGDSGVWLAGAWCWDGMVLLEGCVASAVVAAQGLNVDIPWHTLRTVRTSVNGGRSTPRMLNGSRMKKARSSADQRCE